MTKIITAYLIIGKCIMDGERARVFKAFDLDSPTTSRGVRGGRHGARFCEYTAL